MKISVDTIRFINEHNHSAGDPAPNGVNELIEKIGAQLGAVESVTPFGKRFQGVVIVRIVSCVDHQNSDHLHICKIDDGGAVQKVERDAQGHVQIVTGASNVREGFVAAWLPPGSTVPESIGKEPFVLEARPLRGEVSYGMLASARELTLGDNHDGILEITDDIAPGTPFAEAYHLVDDVVIDMENKMFTHRPDCFGYLGIAREIEGIYHRPYKSPAWYALKPVVPEMNGDELKLELRNELPELVPRFMAVTMRDVTIKPSPIWLQVDLARVGLRPINNIVDYTNFFMLETGQPIHAYDYDKVKALCEAEHAVLTVRHPKPGEQITLLNGKTIEPRADTMMIATDKQLIGVGGVMGGADTEVDEHTKSIIIECATFDMYTIRRTSMAHGIFTDAVTRFNKGQSPLQNPAVLTKIVDEIQKSAEGKVAGPLIDDNHLSGEVMDRGSVHPPVTISRQFITARLGIDLSVEDMAELLQNVEFAVTLDGDNMTVTAPFWRMDIAIAEDIVEEVGRLYGYDHLPLELPKRDITPAARDALLELKAAVRAHLRGAGANEVLTYSFVHGDLFTKVGQDLSLAFKLSNALSPDVQYYRLSLTPNALEKIHPNIKSGYNEFALFEMGKAHTKNEPDEEGLPKEVNALSFVFAAEDKTARQAYAGAAYYQAQRYLANLLAEFHTTEHISLEPLAGADLYANPWITQMVQPFESNRSAVLRDAKGLIWGVVGEFKRSVQKALKLPEFCAGFEIDPLLLLLLGQGHSASRYVSLPRFPKVEQDICLKVDTQMTYQALYDFILAQLDSQHPKNTHYTLEPVDIYQREDDQAHKQITLRISIASYERTMTDTEVNALLDAIAKAAAAELHAERV
jgi:phenylalanyl-tRNA synthetase beta chain